MRVKYKGENMSIVMQERPTYIKKGELKPNTMAIEELRYVKSAENLKSKYPGSPGSINHTFKDDSGQKFVISGDTVFNRMIEDDVYPGMAVSFLYLGKVDNEGNEANYHNWQIGFDPAEQERLAKNIVMKAAPTPANTSPDLDDLA